MAFTYTDKPVLSKVKIGENYYYLKDADVRAILDAINANVYEKLKLDLGAIRDTDKQNGLAVVSDIKTYVDEMKEIAFDVVKVDATVIASADAAKYEQYHNSIVLVETEDAATGSCIEYVIIKDGEAAYKWEQIGTTKVSLTDYVLKTLTIAGIDLQDNITKEELQTALGLKALAYKDSAKGTISTADSVALNYTPEGTVAVTLEQKATEVASTGTFTPAGSITGSAISDGTIAVTLKDAEEASAVTLTKGDYTPAGTISAPAITLAKGTAQAVVTGVATAGTAPSLGEGFYTAGSAASFTPGTFTPASLDEGFYTAGKAATYEHTGFDGGSLGAASKDVFAKEGIKATVGTTGEDAECLIFTAVATGNAVTEQGEYTPAVYGTDAFYGGSATVIDTTKFNGGSKTADTFVANTPAAINIEKFNAGAMPTFNEGSVEVITGATLAEAPKFTGTVAKDALVTGATYAKQVVDAATFSGTAATLGFSGTAGEVAVTGNYNEASVKSAAFTGTAAAADAVALVKTDKEVTVE